MKYSTNNVLISLHRAFSEYARPLGYNIRWHATGDVEAHTSALPEAKATITLVPDFPANPAYIVRLNDGSSPSAEQIAVPAFAIQLPDTPTRMERAGIGESVFFRERVFRIDGFVYDEFQQRELMDLFYTWLQIGDVLLPVWDYDTNSDTPPVLSPLDVWNAYVEKDEFASEVEAIRYYIKVTGVVRYVE